MPENPKQPNAVDPGRGLDLFSDLFCLINWILKE